MRPSQFAKMYEPFRSKKAEKEENEELDANSNNVQSKAVEQNDEPESESQCEDDLDYLVANFIISPFYSSRVRLPEIIKIRDPLPG